MEEASDHIDSLGRVQYSKALGVKLQQLRMKSGLSQEKIAHASGISAYTYQKFEKGESKPGTPMNPRLFTLMSLAETFNTTVSELLELKEFLDI